MDLSGVDLNLLVALDALLKEGSVTRAAHRIRLSQPAMSNALSRLRTLLGDPLFVHTRRGMVPTARAQAFAEPLQRALSELRTVFEPSRTFDAAASVRVFNIAVTDYAEAVIVPLLVRKVRQVAPHVTLRLQPFDRAVPRADLQEGSVDLGITWRLEEQPFAAKGFYTKSLFQERLVCIVRADHPRVGRRLTLDQFIELDHVVAAPIEKYRPIVDVMLQEQGLKRKTAVTSTHYMSVPFFVAQSDMIATVASRIAHQLKKALNLRIVPPPLPLQPLNVRLVWHERSDGDPACHWLRDMLVSLTSRL